MRITDWYWQYERTWLKNSIEKLTETEANSIWIVESELVSIFLLVIMDTLSFNYSLWSPIVVDLDIMCQKNSMIHF